MRHAEACVITRLQGLYEHEPERVLHTEKKLKKLRLYNLVISNLLLTKEKGTF